MSNGEDFNPWHEAPAWAFELRKLLRLILETVVAGTSQVSGTLRKMEIDMPANFSRLEEQVANNRSVDESAIILLNGLTEAIRQLREGADEATQRKIDELVLDLETRNESLATAVRANTPAAPEPPEPTPEPTP